MGQITKDEAIEVFREFSKSKLSSVNFTNEGSVYRFKPSSLTLNFLTLFYLVVFAAPHLLYFFSRFSNSQQWNTILYAVYTSLSVLIIGLFVRFISPKEIVIDGVLKELEMIPKGFIAKYFKKTITIKIADIAEINEIHIKTRNGGEAYFVLNTKAGEKYRLFALSNWDNVTKLRAAFTTLVFNQETAFDDSKEPSVIVDKKIENLLKEKDSETSYLPIITLAFTLLVLLTGYFLYAGFGEMKSYCAQIDSLGLIKLKFWAIALAIYAIPLYFASHTAYQVKKNMTRKTIIVFGLIAMLGFYLCSAGLIQFLNVKMDTSKAVLTQANVVDSYYSMGSKSTRSKYIIVFKIEGVSEKIYVSHHDPNLYNNLKAVMPISIYKGYFNKRWLRIEG